MQLTLVFGLMVCMIGAARSQTWTGTYTADSSCSTSMCCCLAGQVKVTSISSNTYSVTSSTSGTCGVTTFTGTAYTSGYTGWMLVAGNNDTLTLSSDSNTITVTNPVTAACSGKGLRSGTIEQRVNLMLLLSLVLIGTIINISKM